MKKAIYMGFFTDDATWAYRMAVLSAIKHPDLIIEQKPYSGNITWSLFSGDDILILERPSSGHDLSIIKLAKQMGLKIVVDHDDDCLHIPPMNPMWHHYQQCKQVVMECLALADEVWVSTPSLKKSYSLLNPNIYVIPNSHNDYLFPVENKKAFNHKTKKAFWRGGGSHEADVYEVAPELIKIINKNKKWHFQFVGCRFIYMEMRCGDNYTPVSQMPLLQYHEYMSAENPNLVFHPLQDNLFNRSKSNIAWLEATYAGAAFLGNKNLPEFDKECILSINALKEIGKFDFDQLELTNLMSWEYIQENLLLSKINLLRTERLLAI
jgi:hypothetical protein